MACLQPSNATPRTGSVLSELHLAGHTWSCCHLCQHQRHGSCLELPLMQKVSVPVGRGMSLPPRLLPGSCGVEEPSSLHAFLKVLAIPAPLGCAHGTSNVLKQVRRESRQKGTFGRHWCSTVSSGVPHGGGGGANN